MPKDMLGTLPATRTTADGPGLFAGAKAVIFDMDDTLINWRESEMGAIDALAASHFVPKGKSRDEVVGLYNAIMEETWEMWRTQRKWIYVAERLRILEERLGLVGSEADRLGERFHAEAASRLKLLSGAAEAMRAARRGRRTAILTNGRSEIQRPKIERFALHREVDVVGITGELGAWKPDPRAFQIVLDQLGVAARDTVMVGDAIDFDIIPAKKLGMRTVWISPAMPAHHPDADLVVRDPLGLLPHL